MIKIEGIYKREEKIGQELLLDERVFDVILGNGRKARFFDTIDEDIDLSLFAFHANFVRKTGRGREFTFINLKPQTLIKHPEAVFSLLRDKIVIELREDLITDEKLERIKELRKDFPFLLSIDDFGRGASNIDRVISLEPNFVKIDVSLFTNSLGLIKAIELLRHHTRAKLIAEKVENENLFKMVRSAGLELWQGWYERKLIGGGVRK